MDGGKLMLIDLSKKELQSLCEFIAYNNDVDKEMDAIYDKLGGIVRACTCKEDSASWVYVHQVIGLLIPNQF